MWFKTDNVLYNLPSPSLINLESDSIYYRLRHEDKSKILLKRYESSQKAQYVFVKILEEKNLLGLNGIVDIDEIEEEYVKIHNVKK